MKMFKIIIIIIRNWQISVNIKVKNVKIPILMLEVE